MEEYQEFLKLIDRRAGDTFRSAFSYDDDEWTALYVRDDIINKELEDAIPTLLQRVQEHEPMVPHEEYSDLGETQATAELHDDGVVLHFWESSTSGVVVSLEQEVARDLAAFIDRCNTALEDS